MYGMGIQLPKMVKPRKEPEKVYIRFGLWSGRSKNHATGEYEEGVSVYPAFMDDGVVRLDASEFDIPVRSIQGRLAFAVTGERVGTGRDYEPVLRKVKALAYAISWEHMPVGINENWD